MKNEEQVIKLIKTITPEVINMRRKLHSFPELSFKEFKTSQFICNFLSDTGIECVNLANTGVSATIMVDTNLPTIAIRAEMDALPIQEENSFYFASKIPGVMHACGHDGIVAAALGLAKVLHMNKDILNCNVKFIFEPAEEIGKGAKALINEGVLKDPDVDKILIFHYANSEPLGMEIQKGVSTAELCSLSIKIKGKSTHWGELQNGVDSISAASKVISVIDDIRKTYRSKMPMVLGIGTINGGSKGNIVADSVEMKGTLRTFCIEDRDYVLNFLNKRFDEIEKDTCAIIESDIAPRIPSVYNASKLVKIGVEAGIEVFGNERMCISEHPFLAGDNAGFYFQKVPGLRMVFFAEKQGEDNYPLHNSKFDFNESILPLTIETLYRVIDKTGFN
ncbi:M20 metallopeptidase family protein [Clostridium oryzae]|uniref:Putative hydrolase YxeP n=1 Tax=Clostridium oryzae TaxID=1450648 RepID=A0A1V4IQL7_9CLOT|nr:amidohydrolase [Clostridium oryzae]OPJ62104.1 putative hydrolase YxeP [Clostridium oryzae]